MKNVITEQQCVLLEVSLLQALFNNVHINGLKIEQLDDCTLNKTRFMAKQEPVNLFGALAYALGQNSYFLK